MTISKRVAATAALLGGLHVASAQDAGEVIVEVGDCIALEAPVERLACFAAQVEQALTESEAAQSEDGAEQSGDAVANERVVETSPPQPAETEASPPVQQPPEEPATPVQQADAEPVSPAAQIEQAGESESQDPEPESIAAANAVGEADSEDLNWWQRRQARRAARAAEREAAERTAAAEAAENEIVATITALRERGPNAYLITLDNGQMWDQVRPEWYPLRPGQQVRLYPTNWGSSYRLSAIEHGGFIQVTQVR